jgi:hypothetical protein
MAPADFTSLGGVQEKPEQTAGGFESLGGVPEAPSADFSQLGGIPESQHYANLSRDNNFDPVASVARGSVDPETGFQVQKLQDARKAAEPITQRAGEYIGGLASAAANPATYTGMAKGIWNMAGGALQTIWDPLTHAYYSATGDPRAATKQAEATLEGQHGEESAKNIAGALSGSPFPVTRPQFGDENETPEETKALDEEWADKRARYNFNQKVQAAKNALQLSQGRPLDTGAIASIYGAAGQTPSEEVSPEALAGQGSPPVDPEAIERENAISDPQNLVYGLAPQLPGSAYIGGKIAQGVGKAAQVGGRGVDLAVAGAKALGKKMEQYPGSRALAGGVAALTGFTHAIPAAAIGGAGVGLKALQFLGKGIEQQGAATASGIPSALDTAAANARMTGQSAVLANTQRVIGDAATRATSTAVGMAPLNLAMAQGDPNQFVQSEVGAAGFGGMADLLHSSRTALVEAARPALRQKGLESQDTNTPEGRKSAQFIQSLPEAQKNTALELQGTLAGLPVTNAQGEQVPSRMIVQSNADYQATLNTLGIQNVPQGGGQGFFWAPDGTAYINGEHSAFSDPQNASQLMGHEFAGHAAVNMLRAAGEKGGPIYDGMINSAKAELYQPDGKTPTPEFQRFIDSYNKAFDPTGQHQQINAAHPNSVEEFLAETAGRIISQKGAADIALPKNILDKVTDGVGRFMSGFTGVDPRAVGTGGRFDRAEVAKLSGAVRDSLFQLAGMKLRPAEGETGAISRPQTPDEYVQELQETLAKPRPTDTAENVKAWLKEQAQARKDLADFQGTSAGFPGARTAAADDTAHRMAKSDAVDALTNKNGDFKMNPKEAKDLVEKAVSAIGKGDDADDIIEAAKAIKEGYAVAAGEFPKPGYTAQPVPDGKSPSENAIPPTTTTNAPPSSPIPAVPPIPAEEPSKPVVSPHPKTLNVQPVPSSQGQPLPQGPIVATAGDQPVAAETPQVQNPTAAPVAVGPAEVTPQRDPPEKVAADAEQAAIAKEKYQRANTAAGKKRVQDAKVEALAEAGKENPNDLHVATDSLGSKTLVGDIRPDNPYHAAILKELGVSPDQIKGITDAQQLDGLPAYIRYRSAKSDTEGEGGEGSAESISDAQKRASEIEANPAQDRKEWTIQHKVAIPLDTSVTKSGGFSKRFLVLSDLLHNAQSIFEWMKSKGETNPYGETAAEQEQGLAADAQAYAKNHAHGWNGPGTDPMKGFPDSGFPALDPNYQPTVIPQNRFDVLNAMFNNEKAVKVGDKQQTADEKLQKVNDAKTPGAKKTAQGVYDRAVKALRESEELQNINKENGGYFDPNSNETNALRARMKADGFDPDKGFYSVFQNLSPDHILGVSDKPIPHQPGDVDSIRPTGFDIDPAELARQGLPNQKAVAAGFLPDTDQKTDFRQDMRDQGEWMNREARARGYTSINELSQDDPSALTKMGAQWRQFHQREEAGNFLQNQRANAINGELYGDQKPDSEEATEARGRLAGSSGAIGDALSFIGGGERSSAEGIEGERENKAEALRQKAALKDWAVKNGMAIDSLPSRFDVRSDENQGLGEHDAWHDEKTGRWIKSTNRTGEFMGQYPSLKSDGSIAIEEGSPAQYLQRIKDQNELFGDDIRLHAVVIDGNNVKVVTSQPDVSGANVSQPEIDSAMSGSGFDRIGDGRYYRKSDNTAVFDLNPSNAVKNNGVVIPYDAIVTHPDEAMKEAIKDIRFGALAQRSRASFSPSEQTPSEDSTNPEDGVSHGDKLAREAEQAGVVLKTADYKALMTMDPATVARIRARIEQNTGKPARFQPDTTPSRSPSANNDTRRTIPLASILAQQRKAKREEAQK